MFINHLKSKSLITGELQQESNVLGDITDAKDCSQNVYKPFKK